MESAITTQLKMELGIAQGKLIACEKANGVAQEVISRIVGQRNDLEHENASLKAVLGQVKNKVAHLDDHLNDRHEEQIDLYAIDRSDDIRYILSTVPNVLAVVDGRKFVINDEWGEVWAIDVGDTINRLPSGELTVVVLEKGGE